MAAALSAACGDSTGSGGSGGSGAGGSSQGGESQSGGSGGGNGVLCGGIAGIQCGDAEYCDFADDLCGANDGDGVCTPIPESCPAVDEPACGCDGTVYGNACEAGLAGVDVATSGCTAPADSFQCGTGFCDSATQLCTVTGNDTPSPPPFFYSCGPLPASCGGVTPSCDCAGDTATGCGGTCEEVDGGVVIHCPGG